MMKTRQFLAASGIWIDISMLGACTSLSTPQATPESGPALSRLSNQDIALANRNFQSAQEKSTSGNRLLWRNPGTGRSGSIMPIKTYRAQDGLYSRVFDETVTLTKSTESFTKTACRDRDGIWKPI
jgi:surface antigen